MARFRNIAAAVVLYNPSNDALDNIYRYKDVVQRIYAVDNSEQLLRDRSNKLAAIGNVEHIANERNLGVGRALNIAVERALADGYDYLLTMDQDSRVSPGMVQALLTCLDHHDAGTVGILCPIHRTRNTEPPQQSDCRAVLTSMTSGNLINLHIAKKMGPFREDLFIDYVDHDYCLRLRKNGYSVIEARTAVLDHNLGDITMHELFSKKLATTNHPPLRRYFMTRNRFIVMHAFKADFPEYYREQRRAFFVELATLLLFERGKWAKLKAIIKGYVHYRTGTLGFPDNI